jgi:type II secretory pathway predicted ATPase ExeA
LALGEPAHLEPFARQTLSLSAEERMAYLQRPRWIGYSRARQISDYLEEVLRHPKVHRMPNVLLIGESNNGKTMLAARFVERHKPAAESSKVRVLMVQAPAAPDENWFYAGILEALNAPYRPQETAARRQMQVLHLLRSMGLEMLIIDEIHHVLAGHYAKQRYFLNVLKYLGNDLQIPLVGVGTLDALRAVNTEEQIATRFEPVAIPKWEWNPEFRMLLASFERVLPLAEPSYLAAETLGKRLLAMSEGTIGALSSLLNRAAAVAIRKGRESVDEHVLNETDWVRPSQRRQRAELMV